ncbi:MAG: MalT-like region [Acidobacteriota bacterium]|jgi:tetratricopeptide (TPR) repeat protein|nr:MalT-like region [Acidobacteriota bacterium]
MPRIHPRLEILRWPEGLLPEVRERAAAHVLTCPACGESWTGPEEPSDSGYDRVLDRVLTSLQPRFEAAIRELATAQELLEDLLRHPPERREMLVRNSRRFRNLALCSLLLDRSGQAVHYDPRQGERLARLALILVDALDEEAYGELLLEDSRARCWRLIGNSLRVAGELREADKAFQMARAHLRRGTGDYLEKAEWLTHKACLRRAQRRFAEAVGLFRRAVPIFLWVRENTRAAEAVVALALVEEYRGRPEQAISLLEAAIRLLDPRQDRRLLALIRFNLASNLVEAGRLREARVFLSCHPEAFDFPEPLRRLRVRWLEASIAAGLGHFDKAVRGLDAVRGGFLHQGSAFAAALVSLELAGVLARQKRLEAARRLAWQARPIFQALGVVRESLAAGIFIAQMEAALRQS